jgi:mannose-6-phosphate isomerase-like protein (cupin superfamily)
MADSLGNLGYCRRWTPLAPRSCSPGSEADRHDFGEFFRSATLSLTIATWSAESVDDQDRHTKDEAYYVVSGRAWLCVADEDVEVSAGSIAYVAAGVEHRFHDVVEDLRVIDFWAPTRNISATRS